MANVLRTKRIANNVSQIFIPPCTHQPTCFALHNLKLNILRTTVLLEAVSYFGEVDYVTVSPPRNGSTLDVTRCVNVPRDHRQTMLQTKRNELFSFHQTTKRQIAQKSDF